VALGCYGRYRSTKRLLGLHRILTRIEKYKNSDFHYGIKRVKNIENKKK
jgi:hypothetical protein